MGDIDPEVNKAIRPGPARLTIDDLLKEPKLRATWAELYALGNDFFNDIFYQPPERTPVGELPDEIIMMLDRLGLDADALWALKFYFSRETGMVELEVKFSAHEQWLPVHP